MRTRKRVAIALLAGLAIFATPFALAAGLGGLTSSQVGAGNASVVACDGNGASASFSAPAWDATDKRYEITTVTVSGVADACDGSTMKVTVTNPSGAQLTEGTLAIPTSAATSHIVTLSAGAAVESVEGVHVVIGT